MILIYLKLQIMQLHELLNAESTRLSDAREEINQLTNARKSGNLSF